jgi:hypothetical protein
LYTTQCRGPKLRRCNWQRKKVNKKPDARGAVEERWKNIASVFTRIFCRCYGTGRLWALSFA